MKKIVLSIAIFMCSFSAIAQDKWFEDDEWVVVEISADGKEWLKARKDKITDKTAGWFQYKRKKETDTVLYYANCGTSQTLEAVGVTHDNSGNVKREWKGNKWEVVVPDTLNETIYNVICNGKESVDRYGMEMLEYLFDMKEKKSNKKK